MVIQCGSNGQIKNDFRGHLILCKAHRSQRTMLHITYRSADSSDNEVERNLKRKAGQGSTNDTDSSLQKSCSPLSLPFRNAITTPSEDKGICHSIVQSIRIS